MSGAILSLVVVVSLLLGVTFAVRTAEGGRRHLITETFFAFVAFYFLLLGLGMTFGRVNDSGMLLGNLFASLALT
jgi:hypothetical protein